MLDHFLQVVHPFLPSTTLLGGERVPRISERFYGASKKAKAIVPLPELADLERLLNETLPGALPAQNGSSVYRYGEVVRELRPQGVEIASIHQTLRERRYRGGYSSAYRFVRSLEPIEPDATVCVETKPGEEAQVDFGFAALDRLTHGATMVVIAGGSFRACGVQRAKLRIDKDGHNSNDPG